MLIRIFTLLVSLFNFCVQVYSQHTAAIHLKIDNYSYVDNNTAGKVRLYFMNGPMELIAEQPLNNSVNFGSIKPSAERPYILNLFHENISYSMTLWIREGKRYDTTLYVFPVTVKPVQLSYRISHWFIYVHPTDIVCEETIEIFNHDKVVFISENNLAPNFFFSVPEGFSLHSITAEHDVLILPESLKETPYHDYYGVSCPFRPGITKIVLRYAMPRMSDTSIIKQRWHYPVESCNLLIQPADFVLTDSVWTAVDDDELIRNNYRLFRPKSKAPLTKADFKIIFRQSAPVLSESSVMIKDNVIQEQSLIIITGLLTATIIIVWVWSRNKKEKLS